jgi:predicted GIY-YIG superfamily endonuclease
MDKEHKNKVNRDYYHRNKERINFKRRGGDKRINLTEEEKKQKEKAYNDMIRVKMKLQPHKVYLLNDYNYVGTTQWISKRMAQHKYSKGWDCTNYTILFESNDRDECLKLESELHNKGYNGRDKHASYR